MSQATPSDKISEPPAYPVWWWVGRLVDPTRKQDVGARLIATTMRCRTWFDARAEGMRRLECEVHEIRIVQGDRTGVMVDGERYEPGDSTPSRPQIKTSKPKKRR